MNPGNLAPFLSRTQPRAIVVVFVIMVTLFLFTGFLTRSYRQERRIRAESQFDAGQTLAAVGLYAAAIEMYSGALTLSRDNLEYLQALALALVEVGRQQEAELYLLELVASDPSNGEANLALARIYADRGSVRDAVQYYQRAVYGYWTNDPASQRIQVHFELIDYLQNTDQLTDMEAELLRLSSEIPGDPALEKRIAKSFIVAHSYDNAANMFEKVVEDSPRDAEAYAGLGDAEFERGNFISARTAYRRALSYKPDDLQSRTQLEIAEEVISLDPMRRGLSTANQYLRSRRLVERALNGLAYCLPEDLEALPEANRNQVESARDLIEGRTQQRRTTEAAEENIALAEALETFRKRQCGPPPVPDTALELVLEDLARQ